MLYYTLYTLCTIHNTLEGKNGGYGGPRIGGMVDVAGASAGEQAASGECTMG